MNKLAFITKEDKTVHKIGFIALCVVAFCYGWNGQHFKDPK